MTTRRKLREARRNRGLVRPGPANVRVANLASVSENPATVRRILQETLYDGAPPDLVLGVECSDLTLAHHVDPSVWQVIQFGRSLSSDAERVARSGCALIARRSVVRLDKPRLQLGSPAGEGIRARYILTARATFHRHTPARWRTRVRAGHAPPPRAPIGRGRFLDVLRDLAGIRGGDLNVSAETARTLFNTARVHSAGVLHLVTPRWYPTTVGRRVDVGSDHAALDVTLWPRRT